MPDIGDKVVSEIDYFIDSGQVIKRGEVGKVLLTNPLIIQFNNFQTLYTEGQYKVLEEPNKEA